jgi:hypothetical protein
MPAVADVVLLRAAGATREAAAKERAGALYLRVSRTAAERGDSVGEYAAFRASWLLPEPERWRSFAATARPAWPEGPEESIPVLRSAFDRCRQSADHAGVAEWGSACCEALAAQGDWVQVRDVAGSANGLLVPVQDAGARLHLELEVLDARSELGDDVDGEFQRLLMAPLARTDTTAALLHARWGSALARRGMGEAAAVQFADAGARWRIGGDGEDEVAEALMSADAVAQLLGVGSELDESERIAVAEVRGRAATTAVIADRKESEGLRAWLAGRGYDARRALTIAWSLHRRAGHLGASMRLAATLHDLFKQSDSVGDRLTWAIRAGHQLGAREAAVQIGWADAHPHLLVTSAPWELGASFEALAAVGTLASDEEVRFLVGRLLEVASDHESRERMTVIPPAAARRAIATLLCAVGPEHFEAALD